MPPHHPYEKELETVRELALQAGQAIMDVYDRDFSPSVITKIDCDPFTFFRALYLEGELETFWERARFRR